MDVPYTTLSSMYYPSKLPHPLVFFGRDRSALQRGEIFVELLAVRGPAKDEVDVRARQAPAVAVAGGGRGPVPAVGTLEELAPARRRVRDDLGLALLEVREDVPLGSRMRHVVADHEEIERRLFGEPPGAGAVVDRDADRADLARLAQVAELAQRPLGP